MTKTAALHNFFSGFGMKAYSETSITSETAVEFPYLTYTVMTGGFEDQASLNVNLWYHTTSEAIPNAKAEEIAQAIGLGGVLVPAEGGYLWIKRGSPWCQNLADETDGTFKRRLLNIDIEFLTN